MLEGRYWDCNSDKQTHSPFHLWSHNLVGKMAKINIEKLSSERGKDQGFSLSWKQDQGNDIGAKPCSCCTGLKEMTTTEVGTRKRDLLLISLTTLQTNTKLGSEPILVALKPVLFPLYCVASPREAKCHKA